MDSDKRNALGAFGKHLVAAEVEGLDGLLHAKRTEQHESAARFQSIDGDIEVAQCMVAAERLCKRLSAASLHVVCCEVKGYQCCVLV